MSGGETRALDCWEAFASPKPSICLADSTGLGVERDVALFDDGGEWRLRTVLS